MLFNINRCSPTKCQNVTNSACNATASTINVTLSVSQIACNSNFTQSTFAICSNSSLTSILALEVFQGSVLYWPVFDNSFRWYTQSCRFTFINTKTTRRYLYIIYKKTCEDSSTDTTYASQCVTRSRATQFFSNLS